MDLNSEFSITGEYYLESVHEMASGFKLNTDKTFEFFFSYGALDRFADGIWNLVGNKVTFNSAKWPGSDFRMTKSELNGSRKIIIELNETNNALFPHIYASLDQGRQDSWRNFDSHGRLVFEKHEFKFISLAFEFCPERFTSIPVNGEMHNYFRFKPEPWLFKYYFDNFVLSCNNEGFIGKHPLLDDKDYFYSKTVNRC